MMLLQNYTMNLYEIINNFYTREEVESWFKDYELEDFLTEEQIAVITETATHIAAIPITTFLTGDKFDNILPTPFPFFAF